MICLEFRLELRLGTVIWLVFRVGVKVRDRDMVIV